MDKKTDVSRAKLEEGRGGGGGEEKAARHQVKGAASRTPVPDVWVSCHCLEIKSKETFVSEQARGWDARQRVSGVCRRAGRCRDGARGGDRCGGTMANCHEGKVQSDKSLRSNAETHSRFLRGRKAGGESEFSSIFRLFKGLGKYISHQCCTPPPLSQAPPQVIK